MLAALFVPALVAPAVAAPFLVSLQDASIDPLGGGTAGLVGVPRIDLDGAPIVGRALRIGLENGRPGSVGVLAASASGAAVPSVDTGAITHLLPPFFAFGILPLDAQGRSPKLIATPVTAALVGASFFVQGAVFDPAAQGLLAVTEGLVFTIGDGGLAASDPTALFADAKLFAGTSPDNVLLEDFDGDGHLDAAVLLSEDSALRVLAGDGTGAFTTVAELATGLLPVDLVGGDFDGDGRFDLVTPNLVDGTVSVFLGQAGGAFAPATTWAVAPDPRGATVADLDRDGDDDIAVVCSLDFVAVHSVEVLLGAGDGTFAPASSTALPAFATEVRAGRVDADSRVDLVVSLSGANAIATLPGLGGGAFGAPALSGTGPFPEAFALDDLDGDGVLDAVVGDASGQSLSVLHGLGTGAFQLVQTVPLAQDPLEVRTADVNADGFVDAVVGVALDGGAGVLLGNSLGLLAPPLDTPPAPSSGWFDLGDTNGDGALDIVQALGESASLATWVGVGDGSFVSSLAERVPTLVFPHRFEVLDLDRDGVEDLVTIGGQTSAELRVHLGLGGGAFDAGASQSLSTIVRDTVFGDLDGDGREDLLVVNTQTNASVLTWLGGGDGSFNVSASQTVEGSPRDVALGDLDGDGVLDAAFACAFTDRVAVCLGVGDGSFVAPVYMTVANYPIAAGDFPVAVAIGDLDGDGNQDLVVANSEYDFAVSQAIFDAGTVSVLLGNGDGTFAPPAVYYAGPGPRALELVDLDADGVLDVVALNLPWVDGFGGAFEGVSVLRGTGGGALAFPQSFAAGDGPESLDVADLDGDLALDVVVTLRDTDGVALLRGLGDGTLEPPVEFLTGDLPTFVRAIDVDGDRVRDVLVLDRNSSTVSVFHNRLVD